MKLQLLMALAGPLLRAMGQQRLAEHLEAAIEELRVKLDEIFTRLAAVESKCEAVAHGWEEMRHARALLPHADAAEPAKPFETLQERARRVSRHVPDDPPDDHV